MLCGRRFGPQKSPITIDDPNSGLPLQIEFNRGMLNAALRFLSYSASSSLAAARADSSRSAGRARRRWPRRPS